MNTLMINLFVLLLVLIYFFNNQTDGKINSILELDTEKIKKKHQYYRLVTFGFCHGSLFHLVANLLIIRNILFPFFQMTLSIWQFLLIFMLSSVVTGIGLLVYYRKEEFIFVGSSVGFYSFFGLILVYYVQEGWQVFLSSISLAPFYNNLLVWAIFVFILGNVLTSYWEHFKQFSGVFAHSVSFIFGILIGILFY